MHQTLSANRVTLFDVCEQLLPPPAVVVHAIPGRFSWRHEKLSNIGGFHVTSSPPCWWTVKQKIAH